MTAHPVRCRVIVDTDPGIDDAMALRFLAARDDVEIVALTTVFGNANIDMTTHNALYLADRFDLTAPVFRGAMAPMSIPRRPAPVHVHGDDALGGTAAAARFVGAPASEPAYRAIARLVREHPGGVSILAIGPLTNLALALRHDPGIAPLVREVVVMGGAFGHGGRRGNVSPIAEANMANDPHAADAVVSAAWPVTLVGLDVTTACVLPAPVARRIAEKGGADGAFLWSISRAYEELYRAHDGIDGCCVHDVAAAVRLVEPALFRAVTGPVRVVTDGIAQGQTIQKPDYQSFPAGPWDNLPSQQVCVGVDAERLLDVYERAVLTEIHYAAPTA